MKASWLPGIFIVLAFIIFGVLVFSMNTKTAVQTTLSVEVTGLRNNTGNVFVCLYTASPFTNRANIAEYCKTGIINGKAATEFRNIPFRDYAVLVFHDENLNNNHDVSADNVPLEGIGLSNSFEKAANMPDFEQTKFYFGQAKQQVMVKMLYW